MLWVKFLKHVMLQVYMKNKEAIQNLINLYQQFIVLDFRLHLESMQFNNNILVQFYSVLCHLIFSLLSCVDKYANRVLAASYDYSGLHTQGECKFAFLTRHFVLNIYYFAAQTDAGRQTGRSDPTSSILQIYRGRTGNEIQGMLVLSVLFSPIIR